MDRRQKAVALSFLSTISLDGKLVESQGKAKDGVTFTLLTTSGDGQTSLEKASLLNSERINISTEIHRSKSEDQPKSGRIHFIKNMRQHDTRNGRIVLISGRRALYGMFSLLPCRDFSLVIDQQPKSEHQRSLRDPPEDPSNDLDAAEEARRKTVSYTKLLSQTKSLNVSSGGSDFIAMHSGSQCPLSPAYNVLFKAGVRRGFNWNSIRDYDPNLLEDPQWPCGKHKRVLVFQSYMTTLIEYVKPSDLKRDMNETFSQKFPRVQLTLSKIRSLKKEIRKLAQEDCGYEEPTIAMAYVYFEKLALSGKLDKLNRKLCAGACVLLSAKISNDLKKSEVKRLIDRLEERLRVNRRDLLSLEFPVLVYLKFNLNLPQWEILPHYRHLLLQAP
ncbi:hypothetical protein DNTS_013515 [Danionella cerebrum]|uniref:Cyclin N-terminal domain-containing protein n=1 Tax=Danionella cerebrum TaxID=2873325 RepID=A0A553QN23_9TELE|nr:hypothetical protein DNTS_013515 [Danionella translucida]